MSISIPAVQWPVRHDWTPDDVLAVIERPFHDLLAEAHAVHRAHFDPHTVEGAMLLSIKTGGCPEDCAYCPQSAKYSTGLEPQRLMATDEIVPRPRNAKAAGATRFCMGAAWRSPNDRQVEQVADGVRGGRARPRDVRDAGHAHRHAGAAPRRRRARLLQPQPRHVARVLRRDHHDPHLRRSARHAAPMCASAGIKCAVAASWAWARAGATEPACSRNWPRSTRIPRACPINLLVQVRGTPLFGIADARFVRTGAHHRAARHRDAGFGGSPVRGTHRDERRAAGAVPARRRQQHLPRRQAAHHPNPGQTQTAPAPATRHDRCSVLGRGRQLTAGDR